MKLELSEPTLAGNYLNPAWRGRIWGWNIYCDGANIATMTADDTDLRQRRQIAEKIVAAFNAMDAFSQRPGSLTEWTGPPLNVLTGRAGELLDSWRRLWRA